MKVKVRQGYPEYTGEVLPPVKAEAPEQEAEAPEQARIQVQEDAVAAPPPAQKGSIRVLPFRKN